MMGCNFFCQVFLFNWHNLAGQDIRNVPPTRAACIRWSRNGQGDGAQKERCAATLSASESHSFRSCTYYRIMGRISSSEKVLSRAKVNGYTYRAHHEEDSKINNSKYVIKTIKDQESILRRYEM